PDGRRAHLRGRDAIPRDLGFPARPARGGGAHANHGTGTGAMRVMHVHRIRGIGGSERHLLTLLPALAERGIEPVLVGLDDPAWDASDFYGTLRVPAIRLRSPRDVDPLLLGRLVRALSADVVHTHLVHADLYGGIAARAYCSASGASSRRRASTSPSGRCGPCASSIRMRSSSSSARALSGSGSRRSRARVSICSGGCPTLRRG